MEGRWKGCGRKGCGRRWTAVDGGGRYLREGEAGRGFIEAAATLEAEEQVAAARVAHRQVHRLRIVEGVPAHASARPGA